MWIRPMASKLFVWGLTVSLAAGAVAAEGTIWVEGESCRQHTMKRHGWYDNVVKQNLSGGDWLSHYADGTPPVAEFPITVPESGDYHFWIRCNPVGAPRVAFKLDDAPWKDVDVSNATERVNIAAEGKLDIRFIAWVNAGSLTLSKGRHTLRFRFSSQNSNHGAIDCFVLSQRPFQPRGLLKPGERSGQANDGFFAWEPDADAFESTALVDLSSMNEDVAGQSGRVRASGNQFTLGNGQSVKFWASNAGPGIWNLDHQSHVYLAKRLAKTGVNAVRLHGAIYNSRDPAVNRRKLDQLHHLVYALKNEGIYTHLSFYFPLWFHLDGDRRPFMLLFFDKEMQKIYAGWADQLLNTENPYTKLPLGKDPAVAIVELINEDSHFFWTFGKKNMPEKRWKDFTKIYGDWLVEKYGSLDLAMKAWGGVSAPGDAMSQGRMALYDAWSMTTDGINSNPRRRARLSDQVEFLTHNMRSFYERVISYLRRRCSYEGLVSCGNWHVTDPSVLDALERYCYTAGDVIDHHGYFDRGHESADNTSRYSVRRGHEFTSQSALHLRHSNPIPYVETEGYPHIISEIGWPVPNMYRAEFVFLASAYGSLQGLDGIFSFSIGSAGWDQQISKFPVSTPVTLGCFPAAALIFRRGCVRESEPVIKDGLNVKDLYALEGTAVYVTPALDKLRDPGKSAKKKSGPTSIDPLAFYAGRVARTFGKQTGVTQSPELGSLIDRNRKIVRSVTGELVLDYGQGLALINAPQAQGAAGFLGKKATVRLKNVSITMKNNYGTVLVVAMDDQPIARSRKILIQCMTIEQFHGFKATGAGNLSGTIEDVGSAPIGVERFDVRVTLKLGGDKVPVVTACDEHGYPRGVLVTAGGSVEAFTIQLDSTSPYHVIQR